MDANLLHNIESEKDRPYVRIHKNESQKISATEDTGGKSCWREIKSNQKQYDWPDNYYMETDGLCRKTITLPEELGFREDQELLAQAAKDAFNLYFPGNEWVYLNAEVHAGE